MRLIILLITLALISYLVYFYLDSSASTMPGDQDIKTQAQQAIEKSKDAAKQLQQSLDLQQQRLDKEKAENH